MAKKYQPKIGPRDIEILSSIDRCPLTVQQLLKLSQTFARPFGSCADLRRRLRILGQAGLLSHWPYAIATTGRCPEYFKLTRNGFRLLYGERVKLPKRRHFEAISAGHHHHTSSLADMVVHLSLLATEHGCQIESYARENSVCLKAEPFTVFPDAAFVIRRADGQTFPFCVELDNGTERIRSRHDVESIERKLRAYDAHQAQFRKFDRDRYLVLFVTTRSERRLDHILQAASAVMQQPQRTVFIGSSLQQLLQCDPFIDSVFRDHRGLRRTLIPKFNNRLNSKQTIQNIPQKPESVIV